MTGELRAKRHVRFAALFVAGCQGSDADAHRSTLAIEASPIDVSEVLAAYDLTTPVFAAGTSDSTPPSFPKGMALEEDALIFADVGTHRFYRLRFEDSTLASFGRDGAGPGELVAPVGVATVHGDYYVLDGRNARASHYARNGEFLDSRTLDGEAGAFTVLDDRTTVVPRPNDIAEPVLAVMFLRDRAYLLNRLARSRAPLGAVVSELRAALAGSR